MPTEPTPREAIIKLNRIRTDKGERPPEIDMAITAINRCFVKRKPDLNIHDDLLCPNCRAFVKMFTGEFCPKCGQALDWKGEEKLTGNDYQNQAMRTNDGKCVNRMIDKILKYHKFNPDIPGMDKITPLDFGGILYACIGLSGEVGEVNEIIKKWVFHERSFELDQLKKEIGDVMWYIALICDSFNFDLDEIFEINLDKLYKRFPDGFDTYRANHRKPGDN